MRRWLWLRLTRAGRDERAAAKRYWAMLEQGRPQMLAVAARIRACSPHPNRADGRCLDCGTGIITVARRAPSEDAR